MFDICQGTGTNYKELKLTRTAAAPQQLVTALTTFIEINICVQELKSGLFEINICVEKLKSGFFETTPC